MFIADVAGKVHPLDLSAPVFTITTDMTGQEVAIRAEGAYVSHFATCPSVNSFTGGKKK